MTLTLRRPAQVLLAACALALAGAAVPAAAGAEPATAAPKKPSALAPRHTGRRVYGAPIEPPILHRRHKRSHQRSPAKPEQVTSERPAAPSR
jgi:hypothetical protein